MQELVSAGPARTRRTDLTPEFAWLVPVVLAVAGTFVTAHDLPVVAALLAVAVVPWLLLASGRLLPVWLFATVAVVPVLVILMVESLNASVFLTTTACCKLASLADRWWQVAAGAAVGVAVPFASVVSDYPYDLGTLYFVIGNLFATAVGVLLAHARRLGAELRAADARLLALAAQEERAQLARDVHDLVAHSLTVVVLQVGGARRILHTRPAEAEEALGRAESVCRESLDGIREVVGLLRADDETPGATSDLPQLVETYRAAGVTVDVEIDDRAAGLSLLVRGTVYRVVREALANAARYRTPGTPVTVRVDVDALGVTVLVANAGAPGRRAGPGGFGLRGLGEQVAGIGGRLTSGPTGDRWTVECRLPRTVSVGHTELTAR